MLWLLVRVMLPTAGSVYLLVAAIQGMGAQAFILGMFMAISFLANGWLERVENAPYVGDIEIETAPTGIKMFSLNLNESPDTLDQQKQVTFKIHSVS